MKSGSRWTLAHTLLAAFVGLTIIPLVIVTALTAINSRKALRSEINIGLQRDAKVLAENVDSMFFERIKDLVGWRDQEIMQDAAVGDVDKRLSGMLENIQKSYRGLYTRLEFVDADGRVIASSRRQEIGKTRNVSGQPWQTVQFNDMTIFIDPLVDAPGGDKRELAIHTSVINQFTSEPLGELYSILDWENVRALLMQAAGLKGSGHPRLSLLTDRSGHVIDDVTNALKWRDVRWKPVVSVSDDGLLTIEDAKGRRLQFLASEAAPDDRPESSGLGWRAIVAEPRDLAFAPVTRLLHLQLVILGLVAVLAILVAWFLSRRISEPIRDLSDFAREFDEHRDASVPDIGGVREVRELRSAFEEMTRRLFHSRIQLVRASKLAAVGELAANMAHEVRTPLGILQSSAQLLSQDQGLSDQGREMIDFILEETGRLDRLITMLLECGRPRSAVFTLVDLRETVDAVVELLSQKAAEKSIAIETRLAEGDNRIEADREQISQVLINLLLNAVQILPAGGLIRIATRATLSSLVLEIADNGPGIPEEDRQRIFEPFVSGRDGGFGLGLSIVHQILEQHHASIEVTDNESGGATFRVVLPKKQRRDDD